MILAELGELSYNGYHFDGTSKIKVSLEFEKDDSGRTVVGHRHNLHVWTLIQGDSGTNTEMEAIRRQLGEQGRALTFINRGFGSDLVVNGSPGVGGLRDIHWGPVPNILRWEPIASYRCSEMEWEVTTTVPVCDNGVQRFTGLMSLNYEVSFDIDDRGYTTRTISGYLEIAQTRVGRTVPDSADLYLNAYLTTVPLGFHRTQSRHLSSNKSCLEFSVTDKQIPSPNAFPPGIINIQCRHRVGHRIPSGFLRNTITAEIEVAADVPTAHAVIAFHAIANRRIAIAKAFNGVSESTNGGQTIARCGVIYDEFTIEEDIYSRRSSFSLGDRCPLPLIQLMPDATGLWTSTNDTWPDWHNSIAQAQSQRGYAGLNHLPTDDKITDLCQPAGQMGYGTRQNQDQPTVRPSLVAIKNEKPVPQNSWLRYWQRASIFRRRPVVRQAILQITDTDLTGTFDVNGTSGMLYPQKGGADDIVQEGGRSRYYALVTGRAARAGFEIPRPRYPKIGTADATEVDGEFHQALTANWFGLPIYQAVWGLVYMLPHSPGSVNLLPNPFAYLNGDGTAM